MVQHLLIVSAEHVGERVAALDCLGHKFFAGVDAFCLYEDLTHLFRLDEDHTTPVCDQEITLRDKDPANQQRLPEGSFGNAPPGCHRYGRARGDFERILMRRINVRGFSVLDFLKRFPEGIEKLLGWVNEGRPPPYSRPASVDRGMARLTRTRSSIG